jgi:hypothetical protein
MVAQIPFNPNQTTVAGGAFATTSSGLVQGDVFPDPAIIYKKASGTLAQSETKPIWGGCGIYTDVGGAAGGPNGALGTIVGRATSLANLVAFSTWSYGQVITPQSPVPLAASGMQVEYFRLGSGARIVLQADPILVSLQGGLTTADVSWDFVNQLLVPYNAAALTIDSGTYVTATGVVSLTMDVAPDFSAGDAIVVSGLTGTGAFAALDGTFTALSVIGNVVTYNAGAGHGAATITGGSLTLGSGSGSILPVQVLDIVPANCMTVEYPIVGGNATWNYNGSAAVVLI